ncbi:MAG: MMPL family transporter [Deltaproteobacteria bacterium]|nr:MMPL family transporter [Deltaproteobacteria bacterium]
MRRWFQWVLSHRAIVVTICLLISGVAAWSASRAVVASELGKLFLGDSPVYREYKEVSATFSNDEVVVLAWDDEAPLSDASLDRLEAAVESMEALHDVQSVDSLATIQRVRGEGGTLFVESWAELARETDAAGRAELLAELQDDPLVGGSLLSRDGSASALVVELTTDPERASETLPAIIAGITGAMGDAGFDEDSLKLVGLQSQIGAVLEVSMHTLTWVFPFVAILLLLAVWLMFRRIWPAAVSSSIALLGVLWTMGIAVALDPQINVLFAIVPAVILTVAFSDIVHLCSAYLLELGHGKSKDDAILAAAEDVGHACLFTSATTCVGFLSLALVPTPVFRHLGIVLGAGVGIALLQAMTLAPIVFSLLPEPTPLREGATGRVHDLLDGFLRLCERLALGRPWGVIGVSAVLAGILGYGATQLTVETDFGARLDDSHPARVDQSWFLERFQGTNILDLYVVTESDNGVLEDAVWAGMASLHDQLEALPGVDQVGSLVTLMDEVHPALAPSSPEKRPSTRRQLAQYLLLFEGSGGENLSRLLDFPRRRARMSLRLQGEGFRETAVIAEKARALAADLMPPGVSVKPMGMSFLLGDWLDEILVGQRNSLLASFFVIALMMIVALRSKRLGLGSMLPNLLPVVAYIGWLGLTWEFVDSDFLIIAVLALGIGVDDTIHFLVRYRIERDRGQSRDEAIRRTFSFAGRAIVMTTVILVLGFAPFMTTQYLTTQMMGWFVPMALCVAVLADLLLVPAMLVVFEPE